MPRSERFNHEMVEAAMWRAAQESWNEDLTDAKMFNIFCQRRKMSELIDAAEGKTVVKEPHSRIRAINGTGEGKRRGIPIANV